MMSWSRLAWLTQTTSDGGSIDSDVTAVAVMPWRRVWSADVMTVTAAGKRRIASLNDERRSSVAASRDIIPSQSSKDPLLRRMVSDTIFVNANICQSKILDAIDLPAGGCFGYFIGAQLLRHA